MVETDANSGASSFGFPLDAGPLELEAAPASPELVVTPEVASVF